MQPAGWIHIVPLDSRKETTLSIPFTFLSVDWRRNTADISKVYVYFGNQWVSLEDVIPIESSVEITNLRIRWEDSEIGKILALRIGYGLKFGSEITIRKSRIDVPIAIKDSSIMVPVDLQGSAIRVPVHILPYLRSIPVYGAKTLTFSDTLAEQDVAVASSILVLFRIEMITDSNTASAALLADGAQIDETIGASTTQTIDTAKYPFGVVVKNKLTLKAQALSGATTSITVKYWGWSIPDSEG